MFAFKHRHMKTLFTLSALLIGLLTHAQMVGYSIQENSPEDTRTNFVSIDFLGFDFGGNRNVNSLSIGANANWQLQKGLGVDGVLSYKIVSEAGLPPFILFNAGGYKLKSSGKTKEKDIKVRIGGEFVTVDNKSAFSESYIMVPGNQYHQSGLRGGLYLFKKAYKDQAISGKPEVPYTSAGVYAGWMKTVKTNLVLKVDDVKKPLHYRGFTKVYFDLLLTPISSFSYESQAHEEAAEVKNKLLGGRIGYMFYKDGPGVLDKITWGSEIGVRPIDGFFIRASIGYCIIRK